MFSLARQGLLASLFVFVGATLGSLPLAAAPALNPGFTNGLSLSDFLQLVIERNESIQVRILELKIAEKRVKAERGIFEPELLLAYDRVENKRENTAEQRRSSGVVFFDEQNDIYHAGLESLLPTGAKIRLGYTLRDLRNNLQEPQLGTIFTNFPRGEFQTFAGFSLTQPLLKNAWFSSTLANIRLAALASDLAYQEYRRQMMIIITTAEATYWNLYLAQEQVRFVRDSMRLAETLVRDNEGRLQAGKGSELDVLQARAGVALRQTKLAEAEQNFHETATRMLSLMSLSTTDPVPILRPTDAPKGSELVPDFLDSGPVALANNPDYLSQLKKVQQENIRLAYARNQRMPQLDLKASYGLNGLGPDPSSSWDDVQQRGFPSFSAGVELRIPLGGGIKVKNELDAARLRKQQSLITLKEIETQILNALNTTLRKMKTTHGSIRDYEQIASFNQSLLETEMDRLTVGKIDSRRVLEVEASLFEARNAVVEAKVQNERAQLELELVQGSVLGARNLDLPQREIEKRTRELLRQAGFTDQQYLDLMQDLRLHYEKRAPLGAPAPAEKNSSPSPVP